MIEQNELKHALMFSQRVAQLSKALWKSIEKDWQNWIKPYDLNINEHHILWIAYHLKGASVSEIAKFGVMHVSTAFNFSKKLEERGYIEFSKKENDKRNTYIQLTQKGEEIFLDLMGTFTGKENAVYQGAIPLKNLYGKFPELLELNAIVKQIYGEEFMEIFERSLDNLDTEFTEDKGKLVKKSSLDEKVVQ
ncbi:MAG: transcriptional regulator Hpr [Bacillales bacterium]|jgi:MarR family protease production transcriptional regulator HPr|nr:transcriptional regulator Hpr [Bacillales bacterium]